MKGPHIPLSLFCDMVVSYVGFTYLYRQLIYKHVHMIYELSDTLRFASRYIYVLSTTKAARKLNFSYLYRKIIEVFCVDYLNIQECSLYKFVKCKFF